MGTALSQQEDTEQGSSGRWLQLRRNLTKFFRVSFRVLPSVPCAPKRRAPEGREHTPSVCMRTPGQQPPTDLSTSMPAAQPISSPHSVPPPSIHGTSVERLEPPSDPETPEPQITDVSGH